MRVCEVCRARFHGEPTTCPLDGGRLVPLPDPLLGRTIGGRYLVEQKIGAGGMGTVYRARHEVVGRDVAIKFLSPELATDPSHRTRFLREARAANRINHEHIIDITDYGETDDGLVYLVMEYLEGTPLDVEIRKGPMPPERVLKIAYQAARALGRAHELDVVHRDVKPENVYLLQGVEGDFVKILDFGLAHMKGELRVTATGIVFGTPEYMAPEQARGLDPTASADLYSLGCMLFEMLTGRLPFEGGSTDLMLKHMREPPPPPSQRMPEVPPEVDTLVLRLLEKKPTDRFASAYELAEEVKQLLRQFTSAMELTGSIRLPSDKNLALDDTAVGAPAPPRTTRAGVVDAWHQRVKLFRELLERAHPAGDAPSELVARIERVAGRVAEVGTMVERLGQNATEATRHEIEARDARLRIGRAIDELARDEARQAKRLADAEAALAEARASIEQIQAPLLGLWRQVPAPPSRPRDLTVDKVRPLMQAGELGVRWLEAARRIEQTLPQIERLRREREDLRFQIGQLKGRLASDHAETDYDTGGLKARATEIEREVQRSIEQLFEEAEPIVRHFMGFPEIRHMVLASPSDAH